MIQFMIQGQLSCNCDKIARNLPKRCRGHFLGQPNKNHERNSGLQGRCDVKKYIFLLQIALEMKAIDLNVPKVNISGAWSDA
jgi:hypothetical protein